MTYRPSIISFIIIHIYIIILNIKFLILYFNKVTFGNMAIYFRLISNKNLAHFIIVFILFYNYSHEQDFDDHGFYNFLGFFLFQLFYQ